MIIQKETFSPSELSLLLIQFFQNYFYPLSSNIFAFIYNHMKFRTTTQKMNKLSLQKVT